MTDMEYLEERIDQSKDMAEWHEEKVKEYRNSKNKMTLAVWHEAKLQEYKRLLKKDKAELKKLKKYYKENPNEDIL